MKGFYILPKLLHPNQINELNNNIIERTGCFAFLNTERLVVSERPTTAKDAFTVIVVGLYAVYFDCGKALQFIISDELCPDASNPRYLKAHRSHYYSVRDMRNNITHGMLIPSQREKFMRIISGYYLKGQNIANNNWSSFVREISPKQWHMIVEKLIVDSDKLYNLLDDWSLKWQSQKGVVKSLFREKMHDEPIFSKDYCRRKVHALNMEWRKYEEQYDNWLIQLAGDFMKEKKPTPDFLCKTLDSIITENTIVAQSNSLDIAERLGYDFT